ncbi:hypothetical protein XdyCFBP7245_23200 [Xanthomonas dyei]|uniref:Uncharacterized protein n=1 Tax=Xanthomonas dyei TaxID=743699 RepID=A0A2S7BEX9_9XANT|nr:hypothetical protein XdyCFBP7245_23200 [Xanthomonas dyei]
MAITDPPGKPEFCADVGLRALFPMPDMFGQATIPFIDGALFRRCVTMHCARIIKAPVASICTQLRVRLLCVHDPFSVQCELVGMQL